MKKERSHSLGGMREMIALALPMVVSHGCETMMTFTDRMFLARLGPDMMNAAMAGGLTAFMMMTFFLGLLGYTTAVVAQYFGSGKKDKCAVAVTQAAVIALLAYPVILAFKPLIYKLFAATGIPQSQMGPQKEYFDILIYAAIFGLLRVTFNGFFSGIGRSRIVMISSGVAMVVNIILNYILIYGKFGFPAMGIRGAAYGTVIGSMSNIVVLITAYLASNIRKEYSIGRSFKFDRDVMSTLLRFGYPVGIEMFLNLLAFDVIVLVFHSAGAIAATAATIMFNWDMVSFVPLIGIEIGVTSLVGRYMGMRDPDTAHKAAMSGFKMGLMYSSVILLLFMFFPENLADVFRPVSEAGIFLQARSSAVFMIRMASFYVLVEAMMVIFIGALRGAGDTFWTMCLSVSMHWVLVPVLAVLLKVLHLPIETGWTALVMIFFAFSYLVYLRYKQGRWRTIEIVKAAPAPAIVHDDFHEQSDL